MNGLVLGEPNPAVEHEAAKRGLAVQIAKSPVLAFERSLIVAPGIDVPWALLPAGFAFLERWEAAAPFAGPLAAELGNEAERALTARAVGDLRLPVYETGLLFLRDSEGGQRLWAAFRAECTEASEARLAFLRALHAVKPLFLALPGTWLAQPAEGTLVTVQVGPRKFVRCRPDEAAQYLGRYREAVGAGV